MINSIFNSDDSGTNGSGGGGFRRMQVFFFKYIEACDWSIAWIWGLLLVNFHQFWSMIGASWKVINFYWSGYGGEPWMVRTWRRRPHSREQFKGKWSCQGLKVSVVSMYKWIESIVMIVMVITYNFLFLGLTFGITDRMSVQ